MGRDYYISLGAYYALRSVQYTQKILCFAKNVFLGGGGEAREALSAPPPRTLVRPCVRP